MDWLSLIGGILGGQSGSGQGGQQTPGAQYNPYQQTAGYGSGAPQTNFGGGQGGPPMEAIPPVFGMEGPTSVASAAISNPGQQAQLQNPGMPDASFGQYVYDQGPGLLPPPPQDIPGQPPMVSPMDPPSGQMPQMSGPVSTPMGAPNFMNMLQGVNPQGAQQTAPAEQTPQQVGFGDLFNATGTATDPNIFLKLAEGYNRGGLLGALGYGLTKF